MTTIPKIFHQIWLQGEMPKEYKYLRDRMLELHPGWEYEFWTEKNRPKLFNEDIYKKMPMLKFKSDLLRYELLSKYGGVYVDTDFLFLKNMEVFLNKEFIVINQALYKRSPGLTNALIGFPKDHYLIKYLIMKIPELLETKYEIIRKKKGIHGTLLDLVGPGLFYLIKDLEKDFKAINHEHFCPFCSKDIKDIKIQKYPKAYAIHLWNSRFGINLVKDWIKLYDS